MARRGFIRKEMTRQRTVDGNELRIIDLTQKRDDERFRVVVEASPGGILMVDREGLITLVNSQTEKLFGDNRSELIGQPLGETSMGFLPATDLKPTPTLAESSSFKGD